MCDVHAHMHPSAFCISGHDLFDVGAARTKVADGDGMVDVVSARRLIGMRCWLSPAYKPSRFVRRFRRDHLVYEPRKNRGTLVCTLRFGKVNVESRRS